jgi:hypothetical protein
MRYSLLLLPLAALGLAGCVVAEPARPVTTTYVTPATTTTTYTTQGSGMYAAPGSETVTTVRRPY